MGKRIGKIEAHEDLMFSEDAGIIFAKLELVPLRVERLGYKPTFEIYGICKYFDEILDGEIPPTYAVNITRGEDGNLQVSVGSV
jgi:hypothetical protein